MKFWGTIYHIEDKIAAAFWLTIAFLVGVLVGRIL